MNRYIGGEWKSPHSHGNPDILVPRKPVEDAATRQQRRADHPLTDFPFGTAKQLAALSEKDPDDPEVKAITGHPIFDLIDPTELQEIVNTIEESPFAEEEISATKGIYADSVVGANKIRFTEGRALALDAAERRTIQHLRSQALLIRTHQNT